MYRTGQSLSESLRTAGVLSFKHDKTRDKSSYLIQVTLLDYNSKLPLELLVNLLEFLLIHLLGRPANNKTFLGAVPRLGDNVEMDVINNLGVSKR